MIISHIVAAGENNEIGKNNELLWRLPNDMKFFKNTTWGMPVIMGRKTFQSLGNKPLPGRKNIVITRRKDFIASNITVAHSIQEAVEAAQDEFVKECFIIGGAEIYSLSFKLTNRIYLTRVHSKFDADAFYTGINTNEWEKIKEMNFSEDEKHQWPYSFQLWERKAHENPQQ